MYVDETSAAVLTTGDDQIEDILVLHLNGGKDFFISFAFIHLQFSICQLIFLCYMYCTMYYIRAEFVPLNSQIDNKIYFHFAYNWHTVRHVDL